MWWYCDTDPVQKRDRLIWNGYVILLNFIIVHTVVLVLVLWPRLVTFTCLTRHPANCFTALPNRKKVCNFGLGCLLNLHNVCWFLVAQCVCYTVLLQIMLCLVHFFNVHKITQTKLHASTVHKRVPWSSFKCVSILSLAISKVQYTWGSLLLRPLPRFCHGIKFVAE